MRLLQIMNAIAQERKWQDDKYGPVLMHEDNDEIPGTGGHPLGEWLIIIEKELDEAKDALVHGGFQTKKGRDSIRAEIVQIAAVCCAALEQHGIEEPEPSFVDKTLDLPLEEQ